jgi:hypothetical protein
MTDRDFSNAKGISQPHFGNSFSLQAEQVVYAGGAINAGIRMAELQKEQRESGVEQTRCNQRFVALGQYLDLYKLANGIKVYDSNIALTHKLIADIKAKQVQGMALKNDVTRYELQLEQLKLGKRKLQDQKAILNHQLCNTLVLQGVEVVPEIELDKAEGRNISESQWQSDAISSSPMLRQSEIGMQMATQQLKLAKSELLPKVAIVAADNFDGPFVYDLPPVDKNFNIWYVGVGVKYSLSSLFKSNKTIRKAAGPPMTFAMPMFHDFVPEAIRPWIYLLLAFCFQFSNGMYLGAMNNIVGEWGIMREDVQMCLYATLIGMALYFPVLFRMKFRFSNKLLIMSAAVVILVCNLVATFRLPLPVLWIVCVICGMAKIQGTFECMSTIQLWMTPKPDFISF